MLSELTLKMLNADSRDPSEVPPHHTVFHTSFLLSFSIEAITTNETKSLPHSLEGFAPRDSDGFPIPHLNAHYSTKHTRPRTTRNVPQGKIPHPLQKETPKIKW